MKFNIVNERETEPTNVFLEAEYALQCGITAEASTPAWGIATRFYYKITDLPAELSVTNFDSTAGDIRVVFFGSDSSTREYINVVEATKTYKISTSSGTGSLPFDLPDVSTGMLVPLVAILGLGGAAYFMYKEKGAIFT